MCVNTVRPGRKCCKFKRTGSKLLSLLRTLAPSSQYTTSSCTMAAPSSSSSSSSSSAKRRKFDDERAYAASEIPAPVLSLLARSLVMHTGVERGVHDTLAEAVAVLPFTLEEAVHLLGPVADTTDSQPPFTLSHGMDPRKVFLTPMFPPLRSLSVREAVRAWVLADMLCLDAAARRLEDDLVQRYAANPSGEADWRAAFTVDGCPACDTLWERVTMMFSVLHNEWAMVELGGIPAKFGAAPTVNQATVWASEQLAASLAVLQRITTTQQGATGGMVALLLIATLKGHADDGVARAAYEALRSLGRPCYFIEGHTAALNRFTTDGDVRNVFYNAVYDTRHPGLEDVMLRCGTFRALVRVLTKYAEDSAEIKLVCCVLWAAVDSERIARVLVADGALTLMIAALNTHAASASCVKLLFRALSCIVSEDGSAGGAFINAGGIPPSIAELKRIAALDNLATSATDEDVQFYTVLRLVNSAVGDNTEPLESLVAAGIIPLLLCSVKRFLSFNRSSNRSCDFYPLMQLLDRLAQRPAVAALLTPAVFIPYLLAVLTPPYDEYTDVRGLFYDPKTHCCSALYHLALIPANRSFIITARTAFDGNFYAVQQLLIHVLTIGYAGGQAARWACATLALLTTDSDAFRAAVVAADGLPAILGVLCHHAGNAKAVTAATDALRVIASAATSAARVALAASLGGALALLAPPSSPSAAAGVGAAGDVAAVAAAAAVGAAAVTGLAGADEAPAAAAAAGGGAAADVGADAEGNGGE